MNLNFEITVYYKCGFTAAVLISELCHFLHQDGIEVPSDCLFRTGNTICAGNSMKFFDDWKQNKLVGNLNTKPNTYLCIWFSTVSFQRFIPLYKEFLVLNQFNFCIFKTSRTALK